MNVDTGIYFKPQAADPDPEPFEILTKPIVANEIDNPRERQIRNELEAVYKELKAKKKPEKRK